MAKVFISYSRKDIDFAKRLAAELEKNNLDFWVDWEGIPPTVDWWEQIKKGIEEADIFLFLISPDSAKSKICGQEIDTAIKNGKRLIPLVVRDIKGEEAPSKLGHINWIFFREQDDFDSAFKKLLDGIQTDYEWTQNHRRLQVKALEWERNHKEGSFLLRGKDLQDAELQLATNTSKEPHPTDLQREYVLKSRQAADRQRRITTGISVAGIIALAALAVFGFIQAGLATSNANVAIMQASVAKTAEANAEIAQLKAEEESRVANSGRLALESKSNIGNFPQRALLLALESTYININANEPVRPDAEEALRQAMEQVSGFGLPGFKYEVGLLQFTRDDKWLVAGTAYVEGEVKIWNFEKLLNDPTYQPFYLSFPTDFGDRHSSLYMSPQTTWLVIDNQSDAQLLKIDSQDETHEVINFQGSIEFPNNNDDNIILEKQKDKVVIWQLDPEKSTKTEKATFSGSFVTHSEVSKYLITDDPQKGLLLWSFNSPSTAPILLTAKHSSEYDSFIVDPKNNWFILFESTPREEIQVPTYDPDTYLQTGTTPWKGTVITLIPLGKKDPQSYSIPLDILVDTSSIPPKFNKDGSALFYNGTSSPDNQGGTSSIVGVLKFFDQEFLNLSLPIGQEYINLIDFIDENWIYLNTYDGNGNDISKFIDLRDEDLIPDASTSVKPLIYTYGELEFGADGKSILTQDGNQIDFEQLNLNRSIALVPVPETTAVNDPKSLRFILNTNPKEVGLEETPSAITQSSDNNWLVAGGRDGSIRVWDNTVSWRNSSMPLTEPGSYISLSNDNQWMAINNKLWKLKDGKPERFLLLEDENLYNVYGFAVFSPDSRWLVYVEHFDPEKKLPQIKLIDLSATLKEDKLKSTIIDTGNATTTYDKIQFSSNSEWLAVNDGQLFVVGNNSSLFIYNLERRKGYEIQSQANAGFSYTQDQQHMILLPYNYYSNGEQKNTEIWSLPSQENSQPQKIGEIESANTTILSKDGRWVLTIPNLGSPLAVKSKLWDTNCIIDKKECIPFEILANRAGFSPDSNYLLTGYSESEAYASQNKFDVWSLPQDSTQEIQKVYSNHTTQYSPSIGNDGKLIIFGYGTGMSINSAGLFSSWGGYDFNGLNVTTYDGYGRLIFGGGGGGEGTVGSFQKDYSVDTFTPEDAAGSSSNGLIVLHGHESNISVSQISSDEKLILTYSGGARDDGGSAEMILRLWEIDKMRADPNTKGVILPLTLGADTEIKTLAISPDSRWIYIITSNSQGSTLYYFPTSIEKLETQACLAVGRNLTISEWQRYFPEQEYRKTCDNLPVHPSVTAPQ